MEESAAQQPEAAAVEPVEATPAEVSGSPAPRQSNESSIINAAIRDVAGVGSTSNPGGVVPTADLTAAPAAEPAPDDSGDVSAEGQPPTDGQPPKPGRRSARAQADAQRIAELEAEVATLRPPVVDASEEARQARIAAEQRFRSLDARPDDDPSWTTEDWNWLQDEKRKRLLFPDVQAHYETVLAADRAAVQASLHQERNDFLNNFAADMGSTFDLPGLTDADRATLTGSRLFSEHVLLHRKAERAVTEARFRDENAALKAENADLKRQLLGSAQAPPANGNTSNAGVFQSESDMVNSMIRQAARLVR